MATLTITTTAAQDQRLVAAYARLLGTTNPDGSPRNATAAEVKAEVIRQIKSVVQAFEAQRAIELSNPAPFEPS